MVQSAQIVLQIKLQTLKKLHVFHALWVLYITNKNALNKSIIVPYMIGKEIAFLVYQAIYYLKIHAC